jgi:RNA polymerase sigma-70 factor (ECF subfamily)
MPRYNSLNDIDLIDLLKTSDQQAFTEIYNRYWKRLLAIAYNHTKDKSSAEEIVQLVFISLWNRRNKIEIKSVGNYLATATKFTVFKSFYRPIKQQQQFLADIQVETYQLDEETIDAKFLQDYISGCVEKLPDKCRLVFKYSRESGLSIPEIAGEMNLAEKTVEAHLTKALKTLRSNLKQSGSLLVLLVILSDRYS